MDETPCTADNIEASQIRQLRAEAGAAGDMYLIEWCDVARAAHETADTEGYELRSPTGELTTRTEARQILADVINAARAAA